MDSGYHKPVMLRECLEALNINPEGIYVDATFGGGGHSLVLLEKLKGDTLHGENGAPTSKALLEGVCYFFMDDKPKAREAMERARVFVEQQIRENPNDAPHHAQLGLIFAALHRKEDAIREGKRATELLPESKDAFDGPAITISLAQIYAWTGEADQALPLVERSLTTPAGITVPLLKIDPVWDPLRKDPRFQALIDKYSAKT